MKTTHKQVLALLLAVALLLLLCACAQIQQLKGTDSATLPETLAGQASETQSEDPTQHSEITESQRAQHSETTEPQQAQYIGSEEGKNSLLRLRDKIDFSQTMFGMAYLGYVGGLFEEGFEAGFPAWLRETNAALLLEYPFIAEIDAEHIIGGAGHLYCIVPVDENATVVINRVQWNEKRRPMRSRMYSTGQRAANRCCSLQISTALHMKPTPRSSSPTTMGTPANGTHRSMR